MKASRIKYLPMAIILLWGVIAFLFFHIGYKHHLFYQEQNQLFLLSWEYVKSYYTGFGWLARLTGDFLTQFYYYLLAGPAILTVFLLLLGGATYQLLRHWRVGRWWSLADVSQLLAVRYANYDPDTTFIKLGFALSDHQFDFKSRRLSHTTEYRLIEKNPD
jgi:hypothetical protein